MAPSLWPSWAFNGLGILGWELVGQVLCDFSEFAQGHITLPHLTAEGLFN